ncbi:sigma-54-dependent Fis family transcriptional regulator [uncultured Thiodictyon sp.]|uniref:sigma-54 interaction domain-containing protein n=1 Tax=uncultured Thiodictyon sp. TaxID=1846217 RepID=UPI0025F25101|nr:sigma-54-dependent Fis family transcriptional regulator [uncultured Thiodictyon sp.]
MPPTADAPHIKLQSLVDIHDQPFIIIDRAFQVVAINRAFEAVYRVSRTSAVGRPCYQVVPPDIRPCPCSPQGGRCPFMAVFAGEHSESVTHAYRDGEGREHLARIQAYPIHTASGQNAVGELIQLDAVHRDPKVATAAGGLPMIGNSPGFREVLGGILTAAQSLAPVLLQGPTGTGKELAAAHIHRLSRRSAHPFQVLDCTTLTGDLFESEVFGHERGAFTGSTGDHRGIFEQADGGTLFIDEIGEMPLPLQAKLLRVLESGEFRRVGGTRIHRVDVRVICATNRELRGVPWFRQDLYYRIACIALRLPSLAERRADILPLAQELLGRIGRADGRDYSLEPAAMDALLAYDFPGNVRELRNLLWAAAATAQGGRISASQIVAALPREPPIPQPAAHGHCRAPRPIESRRVHWEAQQLETALALHQGNRRAAAQELGVSERTLYRKIRLHGLD